MGTWTVLTCGTLVAQEGPETPVALESNGGGGGGVLNTVVPSLTRPGHNPATARAVVPSPAGEGVRSGLGALLPRHTPAPCPAQFTRAVGGGGGGSCDSRTVVPLGAVARGSVAGARGVGAWPGRQTITDRVTPGQSVVGAGGAGILGGVQGARGAVIPRGAVILPPGGIVAHSDGAEVSCRAGGALRHPTEAVVGAVAAEGGRRGACGAIGAAGANSAPAQHAGFVVVRHLGG